MTRPVPDTLFNGRLAGCFYLDLEVIDVEDLDSGLRSIRFRSPDLLGFECRPGQDVMFDVPGTSPPMRRRYTIRRADPVAGTLDIEAVLHGHGPFANWAREARPGDHIEGIGPRGVTAVSDAAQHVFVADISALPITWALIESLPATQKAAVVFVSSDDAGELSVPEVAATVTVFVTAAGEVATAIAGLGLDPEAAAYVHGERTLVRTAVDALVASGLSMERVTSKSYWRRDQPNAAHGEPDRS